MNDIRPPKRVSTNKPLEQSVTAPEIPPSEPITEKKAAPTITPPLVVKRSWLRRHWLLSIVLALFILLVGCLAGAFMWYQHELAPVSTDDQAKKIRVTIEPGSTPTAIASQLEDAKVIKSRLAFSVYTKLHALRNKLQAGTYALSPTKSTPEIVADLTSGKVDSFTITFLPGATLRENRQQFLKAGYSEREVDDALSKSYDHSLFATKPASADLEGYIFGDTYEFAAGSTVEAILERTFDHYQAFIEEHDLVNRFKKQKLTLYQGIVLASIVQREVSAKDANTPTHDQRQVAQVFLKRLREGTVLGSDVTYKYAAKEFGLIDSPSQDSKYNTRKVKGLPPGPIATPGGGALRAVADPAKGDYEFFLAGDDGKIYYAHTDQQHELNIQRHCQLGCAE